MRVTAESWLFCFSAISEKIPTFFVSSGLLILMDEFQVP